MSEYPREPSVLRPYQFPQEMRLPVSSYYNKNFVDPLFAQYIRKPCNDLTLEATPLTRPELTRRRRGQIFQKMFDSDPCPAGWTSTRSLSKQQQLSLMEYPESDISGYCVPAENEFEPVFYTDKAQFYGNIPLTMKKYQDFPQATPNVQYKDYAYMTPSNPGKYVRSTERYSLLY